MNDTLKRKIYKNEITNNTEFNSEFVMNVQKPALVKKIKEFDCEIVFIRLLPVIEATEHAFKKILTSLPKPGGGEFGKFNMVYRLPYTIRILLEFAIRNCDNFQVIVDDVEKIIDWQNTSPKQVEIPFKSARVLLQVHRMIFVIVVVLCQAVVDLACMRDAMKNLGADPNKINPLVPVDLVVDHSVQVDVARSENAVQAYMEHGFQRNKERFAFLKWGSSAFHNMLVVPPGLGIVHQVNLEYLGMVVFNTDGTLHPDSGVGTDSHTTMIDGLGVAGWGVGGIEAEATMLGQPMSMVLPGVVGFQLSGKLHNGVTATDLVLTVIQMLRKHGVVGKFVEFYGEGMGELSLADRATIANMSPEYGASMGFFPVDHVTLQYFKLTGRSDETVSMIETYLCANKMFGFALPKEEKDKVVKFSFHGQPAELKHGSVVIAALTSCTNTSNPSFMLGAGLVAKKACELGLQVKPWKNKSCSCGLQKYLNEQGFHIVGYGCTTCIGNSGEFDESVASAILDNVSIWDFAILMSPLVVPLVVAYVLAGTVDIDFDKEPFGTGKDGKSVYFKDLWPSNEEIAEVVQTSPPYFNDMTMDPPGPHGVKDAFCLLKFGDSLTTDHISPAGSIHKDSPAAKYLLERGVDYKDFNSYGSRRSNDEVMARGTFANIRLVNKLLNGEVGPKTIHIPTGEKLYVFDAAMKYKAAGQDTIVLAEADYGSGSSRDWAAKGSSTT
ncbi:hypothetical protein ACB098_06G036800 [Castanea mollissima]